MNIEAIDEFLEIKPFQEGVINPDIHINYFYKSQKLNYALFVDLENKTLSIGVNFGEPFGGNSLFEVMVEWDRILIETEPKFYGEQKILVCRKDYPDNENHKTLMIMRWSDSELSVWPSQCINQK